jgi:hypothetical protein
MALSEEIRTAAGALLSLPKLPWFDENPDPYLYHTSKFECLVNGGHPNFTKYINKEWRTVMDVLLVAEEILDEER